jgi:hypothetical protein
MDEPGALNATVSRCHVSIIRRSSLFEPHEQLFPDYLDRVRDVIDTAC